MESAIFSLIGVVLGAVLTVVREWWLQSRRDKKDAQFLAVQVLGLLDRYVAGCANVVADDGLYEGQYNDRGCRECQVKAPKFEPEGLKVEWKSIPVTLMYQILDLPYRAEVASHSISGAFEYAASPPDFEEGFEERQLQYAALGLDAASIASELRIFAGLPSRVSENWNPVAYMDEERSKIEELRKNRAAQHKAITHL